MMRVIPYGSITYATYDSYRTMLAPYAEEHSTIPRFFAGAFAGATAVTLTYPLDLVRARAAVHMGTRPRYIGGHFGAMVEITRTEGLFSLWNGVRPTLLGVLPYAGLNFMLYETFKDLIKSYWSKEDRNIPVTWRLGAGALSGLIAQSSTYPLDIIRRRMQVSTGPTEMGSLVWKILRQEGIWAFYKGLLMNWIKGPVAVSVSFALNDHLKYRMSLAEMPTHSSEDKDKKDST